MVCKPPDMSAGKWTQVGALQEQDLLPTAEPPLKPHISLYGKFKDETLSIRSYFSLPHKLLFLSGERNWIETSISSSNEPIILFFTSRPVVPECIHAYATPCSELTGKQKEDRGITCPPPPPKKTLKCLNTSKKNLKCYRNHLEYFITL